MGPERDGREVSEGFLEKAPPGAVGKGWGIQGAGQRQLWSGESREVGHGGSAGRSQSCHSDQIFFSAAIEVLLRKVSYPTHVAE